MPIEFMIDVYFFGSMINLLVVFGFIKLIEYVFCCYGRNYKDE